MKKIAKPKYSVWVAFSGGKDSLAIAHHMKRFADVKGLLHFNHNLENSDSIEAKCVESAKTLGLPLKIGKTTESPTGSLEAWCREKRYDWFDSVGGDIIVCHHLGDATEQYIMNCFRGHGEYMPIKRIVARKGCNVIRPYIDMYSKEIVKYLDKHKLKDMVVLDPSNTQMDIKRNKVRKMVSEFSECGLEKVVLKKFYRN